MKIEKIALLTDYHSKKSGKTALFYVFIILIYKDFTNNDIGTSKYLANL